MTKIFIDGGAGTTGLNIAERLSTRKDINLLTLPESERKDILARKKALNEADVAILCLPDAAAEEAVTLIENERTVVIDTSTAHRTAEGWTYGFSELIGKDKIAAAKRIANPGCHASGFIALIRPLVKSGLLDKGELLTAFSLTGYTGGGKKMIAEYEGTERDALLDAPRQYGLGQRHKHLPEMKAICGLDVAPCFCPIVGDFPRGMEVTVPLFLSQIKGTKADIISAYESVYTGKVVRYKESADESGFMSASKIAGRDGMEISVSGDDERIVLVARFDNLGKGAGGAAIQNLNIVLGADETEGLKL